MAAALCCAAAAGCAAFHGAGSAPDPFEVVFIKNARWIEGREGYDSSLPGYHITGDISEIIIRPRSAQLPKKLVLAIATSPAMPPNLENFRVAAADKVLDSFAFSERTQVMNPKADRPWDPVAEIKTSECFKYQVKGAEIRVTFLPAAMEMLRQECRISWIDWYRP